MKRLILLAGILFLISVQSIAANTYRIDDQEIEEMFNQYSENSTDFNLSIGMNSNYVAEEVTTEKAPWIAFSLSLVFYCTGISGLHRIYMGTSPGVFIAYIITGGGCGIVQLADTIILGIAAMEDDISPFVDNRKFFMW